MRRKVGARAQGGLRQWKIWFDEARLLYAWCADSLIVAMKRLSFRNVLLAVMMCLSLAQCMKTNVRMYLSGYQNKDGDMQYGVEVHYVLWMLLNPEGGVCASVPRSSYIDLPTGWAPGKEVTSFRQSSITGSLFIPESKDWVKLDLLDDGEPYWKGRFPLKQAKKSSCAVFEKVGEE